MKAEYVALKSMEASAGWEVLQALWLHQLSKIEEGRDKAASRGTESAWRYWAGQEKGFKLAMTALARALIEMEQKDAEIDADAETQERVKNLMDEVRPK